MFFPILSLHTGNLLQYLSLLLIGLLMFLLPQEVESFVVVKSTARSMMQTETKRWNSSKTNIITAVQSTTNQRSHLPNIFTGLYASSIIDVSDDDDNDNDKNGRIIDNDNNDNNNINGFYWNFLGHSCYAEIVHPTMNEIKENRNENTNAKPEILLIHGFACSTVYWRETRSYLNNAGYTVHSVDLLGQGKSSKPGRNTSQDNFGNSNSGSNGGVKYSINLWAQMVDDYSKRYIINCDRNNNNNDKDVDGAGVVMIGNSLGSVVALSAATGDWYFDNSNNNDDDQQQFKDQNQRQPPCLPSKIKGLCFYNIGIGMNSQNLLKTIPTKFVKSIVAIIFDVLNFLIFDNERLLTFVINEKVSKDVLRTALLSLYSYADNPESQVDNELVNSFFDPVRNDSTIKVVEVIRQIYTNDAGKTPMELHGKYYSSDEVTVEKVANNKNDDNDNGDNDSSSEITSSLLPIHLIWGEQDIVTPLNGSVGQFYSKLAEATITSSSRVDVSIDIINQAGHVPFDERPECNAYLIQWLNKKV
mmetsp:Transcript_33718/g.36335  ORF Transcript_33718/g.36335 Transcript_33718/m.36335 type:complete len:530 (+) Transcript_33718:73-1662(+)